MPSGSGVVPSFDSLLFVSQIHAHELLAVLPRAIAILDLERGRPCRSKLRMRFDQPLGIVSVPSMA